jgi:hypothetical protein
MAYYNSNEIKEFLEKLQHILRRSV